MTEGEFLAKMIGKPWVKNACGFDAVDCWGLVVMYYRHVLGIDMPEGKGDFAAGYYRHVGEWRKIDRPSVTAVCFTMFSGNAPTHCGVILSNGAALHAYGNDNTTSGTVQINTVRSLQKLYGRIEFYAHHRQ